MKKILLVLLLGMTFGGFGLGATALAANLPVKAGRLVPVRNWSGCYIGGNIGGGWGERTGDRDVINVNNATIAAGIGVPTTYDTRSSGAVGGGQIGCNYQTGSVVLGMESDLQDSGIRGNSTVNSPAIGTADPTSATADERLKWFGTLRGRVGFTVMDNLLVYGTGGLAYGGVESGVTLLFIPSGDGNYAGSTSETKTGWTAGFGSEYAFGANWSVRAEYLHVDLGTTTVRLTDPTRPGQYFDYGFKHRDDIVRVGLNYRFF